MRPDETAVPGILIVDDHPMMRVGIASIVSANGFRVLGQASNGGEAVRMHRELRPALTLMDLRLPDISGIEAMKQIRRATPAARIVVLTTYEGDEDIHRALEAGASAYLVKGMSHEVLIRALQQVQRGSRFLPHSVMELLHARVPGSYLSVREREVLQLMFEGNNNREITERLRIKEATVKSHVSVILMRLNVTDRTKAVVEALKRGLVHL